jgi:hypothetical protein
MQDSPIQSFPTRDNTSSNEAGADASASAPARPKGPNGGAVVLGLLALVFAALVIAAETMSLQVDWLALGPGAIVGVGALLVVLGVVGLVRRHDQT